MHIFADLLNGCCFQGKTVILPEELLPLDSAQYIQHQSGKTREKIQRFEKAVVSGRTSCHICGRESGIQRLSDACPLYALLTRMNTNVRLRLLRLEQKSVSIIFRPGKVISLLPVLTIVLYYGQEEWTVPRRLSEMIAFRSKTARFREQIPDYPLRLISVRKDMDIELFHTELREVMGILQRVDDKRAMQIFFENNRAAFSRLTEQAFEVIVNCTNSPKLRKYMLENKEGECVDMCRAFEEWMEDCRTEGIKEGENRFARLIQLLERDNRYSDISKAADNPAIRNRLYRKYGL